MSDGSIGAEFLKWVGQALVVGVGWFVVDRLSAQRDHDKARREVIAKTVDTLMEAIDMILEDARAYHLEERNPSMELRLKMSLQDVVMRVLSLSVVCAEESALAPCRADIASLRRAATGAHFEDEHLAALAHGDAQLELIAEAALRAKRSLVRLKHLQFSALTAGSNHMPGSASSGLSK